VIESFGPLALFVPVAVVFALVPIVVGTLIRPRRPDPVKLSPYESGMETIGPTRVQFHNHYYLYALLFVIFDVEAVFLFPWAVAAGQLGLYGLVVMALFVLFLLEGFLYAWRKGALRWP
jgi:NADH-quinone oxidoreductase subunit A